MIARFLLILSLLVVGLSAPALAATDTNNKIFAVCQSAPSSAVCQDRAAQNASGKNPVNHLINVAADIIAGVTGIAAVVLIILGGLSIVTSGGKPDAVANGRKRVISALIGLAIIALAWSVIIFLTNKLITT